MKSLLIAAVVASALAGCATPDATTGEPIVEKEYRTGSNLPVKRSSSGDGVTTMSKEDLERARDSSLNAGSQMPMPKPGGR
jgi:hypothetical protein